MGVGLSVGLPIFSSLLKGKLISDQYGFDASVYEAQAGMVGAQKKLEASQYDRRIGMTKGTGIARTAGAGLGLSGSPLAIMADTESQMLLDRAIGQYNLEVSKRYYQSGADYYKRVGKQKLYTTLLQGGFDAFNNFFNRG